MKSVLISIQPKWVAKISSGEKTIEVRKSRPKLETPFKCYIYETKRKQVEHCDGCDVTYYGRGKVIGEFVCDKIYKIDADSVDWIYIAENYCKYFYEAKDLNCCLSDGELYSYSKGLCLQGWHISDLKIYDKPKGLNKFWYIDCKNKKNGCINCEYKPTCIKNKVIPPQSYCYIEGVL